MTSDDWEQRLKADLPRGLRAETRVAGGERTMARLTVADATVIEPGKQFLVSVLHMIAPFDVPQWVEDLYAVLAVIVVVGLLLSSVMGVLLLPVFYALYRSAHREMD